MGGEGEHCHQGGGKGERHDQGNGSGQTSAHGGMVAPRQDQTKTRAFDSLDPHQQYRGP